MESPINKIVSILVDSETFLNKTVQFAEQLGTPAQEIIVLKREIRHGTINYSSQINQLITGWIARVGRKNVEDLVKLLKRMEFLEMAEILGHEFPPNTILSFPQGDKVETRTKIQQKIWNVAKPVPSFVGRDEEMQRLNDFLENERERLLVVSAMGGQGKTQLCRKWIQVLKQKSECPRVIWLAGESSQILTSSILNFLKNEVPHLDESLLKSFQEILEIIPTVLEEGNKDLWIIDNVDEEYKEIKTFSCFLLVKMKNSKIVVTTRLRTILPKSAVYLTLETLFPEAAKQLIRQSIDGELKEENVKELCNETGFHALALQLSIAFIKSKQISSARGKGYGIKDFLSSFRKDKKPVLEEKEELSGYDKNVLQHVEMAIENLNEKGKKLPQELMKIVSLFRFDGIEFSFLFEVILKTVQGYGEHIYGQPNQDERKKLEVEEALDALHSLSIIQAELPIIQIHPLIQETTRILFPEWTVFASSILKHVDIESLSKSHLQHILRLWEIVSREDSLLREHASVVGVIYEGLYRTSQIQLLLPFTDSHRKNVFRIFGTSKESEVVKAELYCGRALLDTGKPNEALTQLDSLLTNSIRTPWQIDEATLGIENIKATTLNELGRYTEAENVYRSLLPCYIIAYGKEHDDTMTIKTNFALTLHKSNKEKEALELYENVLQWRIANSGNLHQETLTIRHNIACCYAQLGDLQTANAELADILQKEKEVLGDKHFQTLITRSWITGTIREKGDYNKARTEYEELIEDLKEVLGPAHPNTLTCRHNYAICLIELGEAAKATTELEDVIEIESKTLGAHHPEVEDSSTLLEYAKKLQGSNVEASRQKCILLKPLIPLYTYKVCNIL